MECGRVTKQLITIKVFYFFSLSGFGSLFPYLPIIATRLGLSQAEIGLVFGIIPFITFFKNLLLGFLSDKYQKHKQVLAGSCFLAAVFHLCMIAVPEVVTHHTALVNLTCSNNDTAGPSGANERLSSCDAHRSAANTCYFTTTLSEAECLLVCGPNVTTQVTGFSERELLLGPSRDDTRRCDIGAVSTQGDCLYLNTTNCLPASRQCNQSVGEVAVPTVTHGVTGTPTPSSVETPEEVPCVLSCTEEGGANSACSSGFGGTLTFWLFFIFIVFGSESNSSELMLNDAIAYNILGENRHAWGMSRLFGTIGYGLTAVTISILLDYTGNGTQDHVDYSVGFYVYAGLSVCAGVTAMFHKIDHDINCKQVFKDACAAIASPAVAIFMAVMVVLGVLNGMWLTYLFTFLRVELGASLLVVGLCILVQSSVEIVALFTSGRVIKALGEVNCLYLAFAAYTGRYLAYHFLQDYWYALPVELLHALTYGLMYSAASIYTSRIASPGSMGTLQGILNGVHFGLAYGLGSLLGGIIVNERGFRFLFKTAAIIAGVSLGTFILFQEVLLRWLPTLCRSSPDKIPVSQHADDDRDYRRDEEDECSRDDDDGDDSSGSSEADKRGNGARLLGSTSGSDYGSQLTSNA